MSMDIVYVLLIAWNNRVGNRKTGVGVGAWEDWKCGMQDSVDTFFIQYLSV